MGFIPSLSTLSMFESNEAVKGRLIGPKPWDRIDKIFGTPNGAAVTATADLGCLILKFCIKSCIGLDEVGKGRELRVH